MKDLKIYWARVNEIRASLEKSHPDGVHLSTVENLDNGVPAGVVIKCLPNVAARCLARGNHEIATEEQVKAYLKDQEERGARIRSAERARHQQFMVNVPFEQYEEEIRHPKRREKAPEKE